MPVPVPELHVEARSLRVPRAGEPLTLNAFHVDADRAVASPIRYIFRSIESRKPPARGDSKRKRKPPARGPTKD